MLPRRRPRGSLHDGISLDFATGRYYTKAQGGPANIRALTSLFTFTGGAESMYMGPGGLLVASAVNTPRIEYDASGSCLGLLMEAARTNLVIQSADLTAYTLTNVTIGANAIAAPDGTTTADSITETVTSGLHRAQSTSIGVANVANTFSCFVKAGLRTKGRITMGGASGSTIANFDLVAVTATPVTPSGNGTCTAATITALPNGWFRVTATGVPDSTSGLTYAPRIDLADASNNFSYAGDAGSVGLYAWGLQAEAASFASSYIPTTTTSVARTADSCIRTLSTEFSATAGTLVVTGDVLGSVGATPAIASFHNNAGTGAEEMILYANNGQRRWFVADGGVSQGNVLGGSITDGASGKMASVYAVNDLDLAVNGVMSGLQDTSATLPTVTHLDLMRQDASATTLGHIRRLDYFPERKPNAYLMRAST